MIYTPGLRGTSSGTGWPPEGYLEAFANIYRNFAYAVIAKKEGKVQDPLYDFPTVSDGVRGHAVRPDRDWKR